MKQSRRKLGNGGTTGTLWTGLGEEHYLYEPNPTDDAAKLSGSTKSQDGGTVATVLIGTLEGELSWRIHHRRKCWKSPCGSGSRAQDENPAEVHS